MTVGELVSQPGLRLHTLVAGDLARTIRWVHSSEMTDPGAYLSGGEVVLSAGVWYWSGVDPVAWVASLVAARAAAVGFGVTQLLPEVPPDLVEACRASGLTLFRVAHDQAFVTVSEAFIARYVIDQQKPLRDTVRRNQELVAAVATGEGIPGILRVIARHRGGRTFVSSTSRGAIAWDGARPDPDSVAAALQAGELEHGPASVAIARRKARDATSGRPRAATHGAAHGGERPSLLVRPVVGAAPGTYLVAETGGVAESAESRLIVDQAIPFIALELQHAVTARETDRRVAGELFDLVMAGPTMLPAAASRLATLRLEPTEPLLTVIATGSEVEASMDRFEAVLSGEGIRGLVAVKGVEIWAILCRDGQDPEVQDLARRLVTSLGPGASLGVGRPVVGVERLRDSLIVARHACHMARRRRPGGYATHLDVGSHSLLLALTDTSARRAFRDAVLQPIVDHDERRGTQLMATLRAFLESGGEFGTTAADLGVHVNTLRLRLARIETLTGRSLAQAGDRVDLYLALQVDD